MRAEDIHQSTREGLTRSMPPSVLAEALGLVGARDVRDRGHAGRRVSPGQRPGKGEAEAEVARLSHQSEIQGTAVFPPRMQFTTGTPIKIFVDSARLHFFDLESGLALR